MSSGGYELTSPVTGEHIGTVQNASTEQVDRSIEIAADAVERHRQESAFTRAAWCHRIADVIESRADSMARTLTLGHGKPLGQARGEILLAASGFRLAAEEAKRLRGETLPVEDARKLVLTTRKPRGVFAAITPFNFPINIPVEYLGPLLACGNATLWRPAPTTAGIAQGLYQCILDADVPPGLIQLLTGIDIEPAQRMVSHPGVVGVCFTGSTTTGRSIAQAAAGKVQLMELGGNGPIVVLDDADLAVAAPAIASAAFFNSGQSCSAAGRVIADAKVADELVARLVEEAGREVLGSPLTEETTMGPVHSAAVGNAMRRHIAEATAAGASVAHGGATLAAATELYWQPTVLSEVPADTAVMREETFGPIAPVSAVTGGVEALIAAANAGSYGLSSAVFGADLDRTLATAGRLRAGQVTVNDTSNYWELHLPFGGAPGRDSGNGRLGGRYAAEFVTEVQSISINLTERWR